jgi:hypothetical protein
MLDEEEWHEYQQVKQPGRMYVLSDDDLYDSIDDDGSDSFEKEYSTRRSGRQVVRPSRFVSSEPKYNRSKQRYETRSRTSHQESVQGDTEDKSTELGHDQNQDLVQETLGPTTRRSLRQRKSNGYETDNDYKLRKRNRINYANQLYPQAFKEVEQLEEMDRTNRLPPPKSHQMAARAFERAWSGMYPPRANGNNNHKLFRLNEVSFI